MGGGDGMVITVLDRRKEAGWRRGVVRCVGLVQGEADAGRGECRARRSQRLARPAAGSSRRSRRFPLDLRRRPGLDRLWRRPLRPPVVQPTLWIPSGVTVEDRSIGPRAEGETEAQGLGRIQS